MERYAAQLARLDKLAARYEPKVRAGIIRACEAAAEAVLLGASPPVAAALVQPRFLVEPLTELVVACGTAEAKEEYNYLTTAYPQKAQAPPAQVDSWTARLRRYITTEGATSIRAISETIRKRVRAVLVGAAETGLGVVEAAALLRSEVATFSRMEAVAIVRTELIGASNFGSLLGAQATGLKLRKVWLATPGARTRPSHRAAGGQTATLEGFFVVGQSLGRYPGDPLLSAGERIRCRCTVTYELAE